MMTQPLPWAACSCAS